MKLVLGLLMLAGVVLTNEASAERRFGGGGRVIGGGWRPVGGWTEVPSRGFSGCGEWTEVPSYSFSGCGSSSAYYEVPSQTYARSSSGKTYVLIDGEWWAVRSPQVVVNEEYVSPRFNSPSASVVKPQRSSSSQQPEEIATPQANKPRRSDGLLGNPTRDEAPATRYPGVEFFNPRQ